MNRGDVWQLDLGGRAGRRPALVLTRQGVIAHLNKVTVAEITSAGKGYPTEVPIGNKGNLPKESYVELDNIQTVPKDRFGHIGAWSLVVFLLVLYAASIFSPPPPSIIALGVGGLIGWPLALAPWWTDRHRTT